MLKEVEIVIAMANMVNLKAGRERLQKEIEESHAAVAHLKAGLRDRAFLSKAPPAIVTEETDKLERLKELLIQLLIVAISYFSVFPLTTFAYLSEAPGQCANEY